MQGVFDFYRTFPRRPARPERLFYGLFPDAGASARVCRFRRHFLDENDLRGNPLQASRLHVSLHLVGDYKRLRTKFIYAAVQTATAVAMPPFEITFRAVKSFEEGPPIDGRRRGRPLVLLGEGDALFNLHSALGGAMAKNGLRSEGCFTPHMTLSYDLKAIAEQAIEPIRMTVTEFVLVHSELWLTKYNVLYRWPLAG
jgi:RNA 2',3'-cyclic 3'-phosphodiesterase